MSITAVSPAEPSARRGTGSKPDYLEAARALRSLVEREAAVTEAEGTLSEAVVEAFRETGLFWMCLPRELGGGGAGLVEMIEVVEELSRADGSTGWTLMANVGATTVAGAYLGDEAVDVMFGGARKAVLAGMLGPNGKAVPTPGGYRIGGRFSFGSGCAHADWFGAGMMLLIDGKPRPLPSGVPECKVSFIPRDKVEILGNWEVSGLVGTGSFDYVVPDQVVAESFTFERTTTTPLRGGPLFSVGLGTFGGAGHGAVVLGLMKRALEEIVVIAASRKRPGYAGVIADQDVFRYEFGIQEAAYQASRRYVMDVFQDVETTAAAGKRLSPEQTARIRQATTWLHKIAAEVVHFCHLWAGSEAIRLSSTLTRVSRDMAVATQHVIVDPRSIVDAAPALMQSWRTETGG